MSETTPEKRRRGFWMRMAREYADLSQEAAAKELGLKAKSKSTLSKWESGGQEPRASMVARMALLYGVPVELLMNPPMAAFEVIEQRLASLANAAVELEREDWEAGEGPGPASVNGRAATPRRRSV